MAKKLVIDRPLSITAESNSFVTVPDGEVWKATTNRSSYGDIMVFNYDDLTDYTSGRHYLIMGAGSKIYCRDRSFIAGIAPKIVEQ